MKFTERIMGMNCVIEVLDNCTSSDIDEVLEYLHAFDRKFSTYKRGSEISKINAKKIRISEASPEVKHVLDLCEETRILSNGYFNIEVEGYLDPSGLSKGFAMTEASKKLLKKGYKNFYISIGSDIEIHGLKNGLPWKLEVPSPVKTLKSVGISVTDCGVATSGNYESGIQIYNPLKKKLVGDVLSLTVISHNIFEADRFSTAAFAMGEKGIGFLEKHGIDGIMVTRDGKIKKTSGFDLYTIR